MTTKQDALKIIGLYFLVMLVTVGLQYLLVPLFENQLENEAFAITFNTGLNFLIYGVLTLLFLLVFKHLFRFDFQLVKRDVSETVKYTLIGFGIMMMLVVLIGLLYQFFDITEVSENQAVLDFMFANGRLIDYILLGIFTVIFAPIVEELVFRKALMTFFKSSPIVAIVFSGIAFGYIHVTSGDLEQILYYMIIGFALAFFYYKSKYNIYVPIFMHLLFNGLMVSTIFIQLLAA